MKDLTPEFFSSLPAIGKGIRGVREEMPDGSVEISKVISVEEGEGYLDAWLDVLPLHRKILFKDVISPSLASKLQKRGFFAVGTPEGTGASWERFDDIAARRQQLREREFGKPQAEQGRLQPRGGRYAVVKASAINDGEFLWLNTVQSAGVGQNAWDKKPSTDSWFQGWKLARRAVEFNGGAILSHREAVRLGLVQQPKANLSR